MSKRDRVRAKRKRRKENKKRQAARTSNAREPTMHLYDARDPLEREAAMRSITGATNRHCVECGAPEMRAATAEEIKARGDLPPDAKGHAVCPACAQFSFVFGGGGMEYTRPVRPGHDASELDDLRICEACSARGTGYTFVATVHGVDPEVCPDCKVGVFKLWNELGYDTPEAALPEPSPAPEPRSTS